MYRKVLNYLRGQVTVEVESAAPERVLNLCAAHNIPFWELEWLSEIRLRAVTSRAALPRLQAALAQTDAAVTVLRRQGAPEVWRQYRRRYVLWAAAGLLLAASVLNINITRALWICIIGNIIPVPFILLLITPIFNWLKQTKTFRPMVEKMEARALSKREQVEKYEFWGLVLFVGIPLPGTGAWTGSLLAALLGMKFKKAFPAVLLGIALASVIMSIVSYGLLGALIH